MSEVVPIDTLCLCVRAPNHPRFIGRECVVIAHNARSPIERKWRPYLVRFKDGEVVGLYRRNIIPLLPPKPPRADATQVPKAKRELATT